MDCFAEPVIGRAFARPGGSQRRRGSFVIACDKREAFAQGSAATKQSSLSLRSEMDCFAALAMTERRRALPSLRGAQRRSNPVFRFVAQYWIASLRSQ
jgi:hypothetical protein